MTAELTHAEDFALYTNDFAAWCRLRAPWWLGQLRKAANETERREIWSKASPLLRDEITKLSKETPK